MDEIPAARQSAKDGTADMQHVPSTREGVNNIKTGRQLPNSGIGITGSPVKGDIRIACSMGGEKVWPQDASSRNDAVRVAT